MPRKPLYYDSENGKKEVLGTSGSFEEVPDAPTSALPVEYPATYAAMQTSITADTTTKRDFFVSADETNGGVATRYSYNGSTVFPITSFTPNTININLAPYNATVGQDITSIIQTAINNLDSIGGGIIYFSKPGTYLINGAQQSGTAQGVNYSGQLLFPAHSHPGAAPSFRIKGPIAASVGGGTEDISGVVLKSNTNTGNVFDVIPGFLNPSPFSNITVEFEDITLIVNQTNPQSGGINCSRAARFKAKGLVVMSTASSSASLTGTTNAGLQLPGLNNFGLSDLDGGIHIQGFPIGVSIAEHTTFKGYVALYTCNKAIQLSGGAIVNRLQNVQIGGCQTALYAPNGGGGQVSGIIHVEPSGVTSGLLVDDQFSLISGDLKLHITAFPTAGGFPGRGAKYLNLSGLYAVGYASQSGNSQSSRGVAWGQSHPVDSFLRVMTASSSAGLPGHCSDTLHPWRVQSGTFGEPAQTASYGKLKNNGSYASAYVPALNGGVSRVVEADVLWNSNIQLFAQYVNGGSNNGHSIMANLVSGTINLVVNGSTVASASAGVVVAGTAYTVSISVLMDVMGRPKSAEVFLNGTSVIAATSILSTAGLTGGTNAPYIEDGIGIVGSTDEIRGFRVRTI